jgi:hypothetical protein
MFARAAFHDGAQTLDKTTLDRIIDRAIGLFQAGDLHAARALFYLATPNHVIAARALDALGVPPPRRRRPLTGPTTHPGADSDAGPAGDGAPYGDRRLARLPAAPVAAQVLLWEDARRDADGWLLGVYVPVPVIWPPGLCQHTQTICPQCLLSWADDHALALFDHGPDGAAAGCQCPTCHPQPTAPPQPASTRDPVPPGSPSTAPARPVPSEDDATCPARTVASGGTGGTGGGWYRRDVTVAGHVVGLSIDPATGLAAVSYPGRPPQRLGTGPHLAVLAAVADTLELFAGPGRRYGDTGVTTAAGPA